MFEANILINSKILFEQDGWLLLDYKKGSGLLYEGYASELYHKCIPHEELKTAFLCVCATDHYTGNIWRCTNCQAIVPPEFVGLWKLHNFDKQAEQDEE